MTTIACSLKGLSMAADSRVNLDAIHFPSKKIEIIQGSIVGAAGDSVNINAFLSWLKKPKRSTPPDIAEGTDFEGLVLTKDGIYWYESDFVPLKVERDFHAIGSGAAAAIAAMMCGKTPLQAVKIACQIDPGSGLPVDVLKIATTN